MSGAFKIGEPFKDLLEYESYSYSHLYNHGNLIGKSITDNWQFRRISFDIKNKNLCKAELSEEYKMYAVQAVVSGEGIEFEYNASFPAKTKKEAERKMIRSRFNKAVEATGTEHEYRYKDGSGVVRLKAVAIDD